MEWCIIFGLTLLSIFKTSTCDINKGFDDTLLFSINFPGDSINPLDFADAEHMIVTSSHHEKYKCILPSIQERETDGPEKYDGPTPLELIAPLFSQASCSYRLESYWTYEVCHGRYIRQFHEDREGKKVKLQEYFLGRWEKGRFETLLEENIAKNDNENQKVPTKKIDGVNLPYYEILMGNGTLCELNHNKPRETKMIYVCYVHGKHEIFSLKETSTCQYEVVILSPLLCRHPKYKPQETGENIINCLPLDDSPKKPRNLMKMQQESAKLRRKEVETIRLEFFPLNSNEKEDTTKPPEVLLDTSPVESFLSGQNCLNGGTGWWKFEFCYGKHIEQYHVEPDGTRSSINLGYFDREKHLEWIRQHEHKRPKPLAQRTQLSHFYSGGTVCDKTGKPRQTEVKLKCLGNTASANAVSLYLLEPKYCEYILGVESPLICDILARADENGLVERNSSEDTLTEDVSSNVITY